MFNGDLDPKVYDEKEEQALKHKLKKEGDSDDDESEGKTALKEIK